MTMSRITSKRPMAPRHRPRAAEYFAADPALKRDDSLFAGTT